MGFSNNNNRSDHHTPFSSDCCLHSIVLGLQRLFALHRLVANCFSTWFSYAIMNSTTCLMVQLYSNSFGKTFVCISDLCSLQSCLRQVHWVEPFSNSPKLIALRANIEVCWQRRSQQRFCFDKLAAQRESQLLLKLWKLKILWLFFHSLWNAVGYFQGEKLTVIFAWLKSSSWIHFKFSLLLRWYSKMEVESENKTTDGKG